MPAPSTVTIAIPPAPRKVGAAAVEVENGIASGVYPDTTTPEMVHTDGGDRFDVEVVLVGSELVPPPMTLVVVMLLFGVVWVGW